MNDELTPEPTPPAGGSAPHVDDGGATPAGPATDATTPASTPDASEATPAPVPTATATP